jgi:hypothetical protein
MLPGRVGAKGKASAKTGRPGMGQRKALVLGVLRSGLNTDYDRPHELANQHKTVRQVLGLSDWLEESHYELQALKDMRTYWDWYNQIELQNLLDCVALPKKGRWSEADKARESAPEFVLRRRQHPAVESAINALEVHVPVKCPDHGIDVFKRCVALAVVARNIRRLGAILREQEKQGQEAKRRRGLTTKRLPDHPINRQHFEACQDRCALKSP